MVNTYKSTQFDPDTPLPKGYQGRSALDEYLYGGGNAYDFNNMRDQALRKIMRENRNYSALNYAPINDKNYSAVYGYSSDPRKRNLPSLLKQPSNRQTPIGIANDGVKQTGTGTGTGTDNTPPNFKNNLLNYLVSPKGKGMAQGLLEASGYSDVPITAGQALAMGMKRSNESQAAADASVAAQQKAYMDNLLVQSQIYKNYQPSGNPQHKFRPMTAEEKKAYGIPENVAARFNETLNKPEIMSTGGGTSVTVVNEGIDKGTESWFESRGDAFSKTVDTLSSSADAADIDNQSLARFVQLSELAKTGKTAELLADIQGWADSLGVDLSGLDLANMGATQALNSVAGRFVMQQVQKTKGAVSDREMAYFMKISANIGNSPLGNQLIINMAKSMNDRVIQENILLNNYLDEMYAKDPNMSAYALERGWKKKQQKFRDENQLFQGDIKDEIKAYYDDNDIKYTDSTKVIEDTLEQYPNAKYMGVDEDDKLQFKIYKDGAWKYFSVGA